MFRKLSALLVSCILLTPSALLAANSTSNPNHTIGVTPSSTHICFFDDAAFVLRICDFDFGGCTDINGGQTIRVDISKSLQKYGEAHFIVQGILVSKTPLNITFRRAGDTLHVRGDAWISKMIVELDPQNCG